jgi:hypothetical protein
VGLLRPPRARRRRRFSSAHDLRRKINPTTLRAVAATEAIDRLSEEKANAIHRGDAHTAAIVKLHYDKRAAERAATAADAAFAELRGGPALDLLGGTIAPVAPPIATPAVSAPFTQRKRRAERIEFTPGEEAWLWHWARTHPDACDSMHCWEEGLVAHTALPQSERVLHPHRDTPKKLYDKYRHLRAVRRPKVT